MNAIFDNPMLNLCAICGLEKELTFEHIPPKSAFNDRPLAIQDLRHLTVLGGHLEGKYAKSPRGFGGYKLCKECNNLTGTWYVKSYVEVVNQIHNSITANSGPRIIEIKCKIKPLNFIKQVVCMFLGADQATGSIRASVEESNFILDKESQELSDEISIWQSISVTQPYILQGVVPSWDDVNGFRNYALIAFTPFIFQLYYNGKPPEDFFVDITNYKNYCYNEVMEARSVLEIVT